MNCKQKSVSENMISSLFLSGRKEYESLCHCDGQTPKQKRQIELLNTPHMGEKQKDLFSQLLGTETKYASPLTKSSFPIVLQQSYQLQLEKIQDQDDEVGYQTQAKQLHQEEQRSSHQGTLGEENRKRKRKSNAQLKFLKQQFIKKDGTTWNKDKIIQMAALTGLSESQVYKWCWDQKKKMSNGYRQSVQQQELNSKIEEPIKTKQIAKKEYTRRKQSRIFSEDSYNISKKLFFN